MHRAAKHIEPVRNHVKPIGGGQRQFEDHGPRLRGQPCIHCGSGAGDEPAGLPCRIFQQQGGSHDGGRHRGQALHHSLEARPSVGDQARDREKHQDARPSRRAKAVVDEQDRAQRRINRGVQPERDDEADHPDDQQRQAAPLEGPQSHTSEGDGHKAGEQPAFVLAERAAPTAVNDVLVWGGQVVPHGGRVGLNVATVAIAQAAAIKHVDRQVWQHDRGARHASRETRSCQRGATCGGQAAPADRDHDQHRRRQEDGVVNTAVNLGDHRRHGEPHVATRTGVEGPIDPHQDERQEHRGLQFEMVEVIESKRHEREHHPGQQRS